MKYEDDPTDVGYEVPLELFDLDTHTGEIPKHLGPERDEKGRVRVDLMTARELLEEIALSQRVTRDMVEQFVAAMETNPMLKMMTGNGAMARMMGGRK